MDLLHPLRLGRVEVPNNLVLSPMAGYTDQAFRALCRQHGAGLVCTEMVAATSLAHEGPATLQRMATTEAERPVSIQIVGNEPDAVARAARLAGERCDVLGFNLGCPARQVAAQGCGAALLDHPDLAVELVATIKAASPLPLLVKLRTGTRSVMDCAGFARRLEAAGADGLIVHGRTAAQGYGGRADWGLVRVVKQAVDIPVVGNGDVRTPQDAERCLRESGCDGLAIGRAALGDPRVFARLGAWLRAGEALPPPTPDERLADFRAYVARATAGGYGLSRIVPHAHGFTKSIPGGSALRERLLAAGSPEEALALFEATVAALRPPHGEPVEAAVTPS